MMRSHVARWTSCAAAVACAVIASCGRHTQSSRLYVDTSIQAELREIRAIDNHAHPMALSSPGQEDHDYDALSMEGIDDLALPAAFQDGNPYFAQAWHALFGYRYSDAKPEHLAELESKKRQIGREKGDLYPAWVLDQANVEIMLANRVAMGRGLTSDRFKWVPFADMFLFPLNNDAIKAQDPDHRIFMRREEQLLKRYLAGAQLQQLPVRFDDYLGFVTRMLQNWRGAGAVAVKFELGYLRSLQISNAQRENAERVYALYSRGSEPSPEEYKILQDYLFRHIAQEAGRLGMPVHFHCAVGAGSYFRVANANPLQMDELFNDPSMRKTKFVMLHGGWPFTREAAAEILKPNVYVDFSAFMYETYPAEGAQAIRTYLEAAPEKVLYGSDASPFSDSIGWEETAWIGSTTGRLSLGLALTGMMGDGEITRARAKQIAHMVMRENARRLYGF